MELRTKKSQRAASVSKLLDAARHLFVSKGYASTTLQEIAEAVGMTKGSVYFYFQSKEAVLMSVLRQAGEIVIDPAVDLIAADASPTEILVQFLHRQSRLSLTDRENMLLIILMSLEFDDGDLAAQLRALYARLAESLAGLIRRGQASGDFRRDVDAHELAAVVVAYHDGMFLEWFRRGDELDGAKFVRALRAVLLAGMRG